MIRIVQIILASVGIINLFIVAMFLFFSKKGNLHANKILGFLLLAACLKLSFAFILNFEHGWDMPIRIICFFSEVGYLLLGPLLLMYIRAQAQKTTSKLFITSFVTISAIYTFLDVIIYYNYPLWPGQIFFLVFLVIAFFEIKEFSTKFKHKASLVTDRFWLWTLFINFVLIWITVNLIMIDLSMYMFELCSIFTILFYIDAYILVKQYWLNKGDEVVIQKYINSNLSTDEGNEIINRLQQLMERENSYIDPEITLPKVAEKINVKPYKLSQVINQKMNMSFNEYINSYRINAIKEALKSSDQDIKIASFAVDYGFNSISSFNTAFKKFTNLTPSQYRNEILTNSQN
jgi:AraC-like DNA-binding protein